MSIGDNTRQIILGRLAKSQDLSEIRYCKELWIQTHEYKSLCFIGLTSQLAFDRKAFFINTKKYEEDGLKSRLTPNVLLSLRRAVINEEFSVI